MKEELAISYVSRRMQELGHGNRYTVRVRHFVLPPSGKVRLKAWRELFVLLGESCDARITSDLGVFDLAAANLSEQQHEHSGQVLLENTGGASSVHIKFMQAIPLTN